MMYLQLSNLDVTIQLLNKMIIQKSILVLPLISVSINSLRNFSCQSLTDMRSLISLGTVIKLTLHGQP